MSQTHPHTDPPPDLPPRIRRTNAAIAYKRLGRVAELAPQCAVRRERAQGGHASVAGAQHLHRDALAELIVFVRSVGALVEQRGRWFPWVMGVGMLVLAGAEMALGVPGLRFALGHVGEIDSPLDDPMAHVAAFGFVVASLMLADIAGREAALSDRSVLQDPVPARAWTDPRMPEILPDCDGDRLLPDGIGADDTDGELAEVVELAAVAGPEPAERLRENAEELAQRRFDMVVRDTVTRGRRRIRAGLAALAGVLLWGFNGYLRASYTLALEQHSSGPVVTGVGADGGGAAATSSAPAGMDYLELAMIGLGIVFFLAMVMIAAHRHSALELRRRQLERRVQDTQKALEATLEAAGASIEEFEESRSQIELARGLEINELETARAGWMRR